VRNLTVAAFVCLAISSRAFAADPNDTARKPTHIPAQELGPALKQLADDRELHLLYFSDTVRNLRTAGASGELSAEEALTALLNGTGLSFRHVDHTAIAIVPPASSDSNARTATTAGGKASADASEAQRTPDDAKASGSFWDRFRLAQGNAGQAQNGASQPVTGATDVGSAGDPPHSAQLEEVVVTAEKRKERLLETPVAVTALSGETLSETHIYDTAGLASLTPSLTFTQGNHVNNSSFRIRGVGTQVFGAGLEPDVSVVVDGVVLARSAEGFADLADIERVEVLRGPQGTLFGKNAIAGLINVTTKAPSKELEGNADATVAELGEYRFHGSFSGPVTESLGFRLTGYYDGVEGNIHNIPNDRRTNGADSSGIRGKLFWQATDTLDFTLSGDYRNMHGYCCASTFVQASSPLLQQLLGRAGVVAGINNRQDDENTLSWQTTGQSIFSLTGNLQLGNAGTLTSVSAYQAFDFNNNQPVDYLNTPVPLYFPVTNGAFDINGGPMTVGEFTQELRFTSPGGERFNYVAGLYYLNSNVNRGFIRRTGNCAPGGAPAQYGLPCVVPLYRSQAGFHSNNRDQNVAAFAQSDLQLIGGLTALGGVRVQNEHLSYWGIRPANSFLFPGDLQLAGISPSSGSGSATHTAATEKAGFKYAFSPDAEAYLTRASGYKGAGYGTEFATTFENQQPVRPETAKTWEFGYKAQMFDSRLRLNTAVFYADYRNLQVQANRGNPDTGVVLFAPTNAGSAIDKGVEVEFDSRPLRSLTFSGGVTYLETSVNIAGLQCPLSAQAAAPVIAASSPVNTCYKPAAGAQPIQNVAGGVLPQASKWRGNLLARYDHAIPGTPLGGFVQASAVSQSKFNFTIEQDPLTVQKAYTVVNTSIGLHDLGGRYEVSLFANNVFNQHYLTSIARAASLTTAAYFPNSLVGTVPKDADRYFGATVSVSF
jgi:iron complex outermembrane recepter protein